MKLKAICVFILLLSLTAAIASADTLELKNGSVIKGKFVAGNQNEITFRVGSSQQTYNLDDIVSLKFDSERGRREVPSASEHPSFSDRDDRPSRPVENASLRERSSITIPSGTQISVRTIDGIDSTKNRAGDRFQASLEESIFVDGDEVVSKGTDVYGRLTESKSTGTFSGRSQLSLELTGILINGQNVPITTGEYEVSGKSKGSSTAKRTIGGAAVGTIIGAIAGGGKGAAIGAGVGAGAGAGSEIITKGDQVKVPSETLLDFTLQQDVTVRSGGDRQGQ
ncbi:MAG: hypothetical protein C5B46_03960 [Proteobacteria bacterium]|nr:MAG: hypothetical protein C5B46_03960 [Pseudomonadota bacterium]